MRRVEVTALLLVVALLVPRAACGPALLASDQGYFGFGGIPKHDKEEGNGAEESEGFGRVVYETLGHTGLAGLVKQVLHHPSKGGDDAAPAAARKGAVGGSSPVIATTGGGDIVDRARLAAAPPEVVMVYAGSHWWDGSASTDPSLKAPRFQSLIAEKDQ